MSLAFWVYSGLEHSLAMLLFTFDKHRIRRPRAEISEQKLLTNFILHLGRFPIK